MKKILILILGIILIIGIINATNLKDKIKIEKVGETFEIWKKTGEYTQEEISSKTKKIEDDIKKLEPEEEYWEKNFYPACVKDCPMMCKEMESEENLEICIDQCPFECASQRDLIIEYNNQKINELNNEKDLFLTIK